MTFAGQPQTTLIKQNAAKQSLINFISEGPLEMPGQMQLMIGSQNEENNATMQQ